MSCPEQQTLSAFVDGELETAATAEVRQHLAECTACRKFAEEMEWLDNRGRSALLSIRVSRPAAEARRGSMSKRRHWIIPISLAASIVILVAIFVSNRAGRKRFPSGENRLASTIAKSRVARDIAFGQWIAQHANKHVPLLPMDIAADYNPPPILPIRPNHSEILRQ
jgi:anti-sigma factor RsiW